MDVSLKMKKLISAALCYFSCNFYPGTYIDGEPIVDIPPKTIELKRVDFSMEERDFYCRLEADSQAQFAVRYY